jgi:hypothetical protein
MLPRHARERHAKAAQCRKRGRKRVKSGVNAPVGATDKGVKTGVKRPVREGPVRVKSLFTI